MASQALIDARVEINATDLSDWVRSVTLPVAFDELDDTAMGDTARSRIAGLEDGSIQIEFNQDFAAGAVDTTIWPLRKTVVVIKVRPTSAAISATNPEYVGDYLISQWQPFGNAVGELAVVSVTWPLSDPTGIARNVA